MKRVRIAVMVVLIAVFVLGIGMQGKSSADTLIQLALSSSGSQANLTGGGSSITPDGRYVAFASNASYVVSGDTNGKQDVFVRDTGNGTTTRISVSSSGTQSNDDSSQPVITDNGRYVIFYSVATNLDSLSAVPWYAQYLGGLYLHDMKTGTTTLIDYSYTEWYTQPQRVYVYVTGNSLSEDARFIYYTKTDPTTGLTQVYAKDTLLNTTNLISKSNSGTVGNAMSQSASNSCDGRFVAFASTATNLVSGDTNGKRDVFLVDTMGTQQVTDITVSADDSSSSPTVTCDGNYVFYNSDATNLVSGDTNGLGDVFMYNVSTGDTTRVSINDNGDQNGGTTGTSNRAIASADGRYVIFSSVPNSLSYNETYVRDIWSNTTKLVSVNSSSLQADGDSEPLAIATDGQAVYYASTADNLGVSNSSHDAYLYKVTDF